MLFDLWCFTTTKIQFQPALHASDCPVNEINWWQFIQGSHLSSPFFLSPFSSFNRGDNSQPRLWWNQCLTNMSVFQGIQQNRQADANRKACRRLWEIENNVCIYYLMTWKTFRVCLIQSDYAWISSSGTLGVISLQLFHFGTFIDAIWWSWMMPAISRVIADTLLSNPTRTVPSWAK